MSFFPHNGVDPYGKQDFIDYYPTKELADKAWEHFLAGVGFGDDTPDEMFDAWRADGEELEKEKLKIDRGLAAEEQGLTPLDFILGVKPDMDKYYKKGGNN